MSVIVKLTDGLGNQLFQYACGLAVAMRTNQPLLVDNTWYRSIAEQYTKRKYLLNQFNISAAEATEKEINILKKPKYPIIINSLYYRWQYSLPTYKRRYYKEPHFHYDGNTFKINKSVYLEGFWQSECYFKEIKEPLLQEFSLKKPLSASAQAIEKQILFTNSVAVHIRRGDYTQRNKNPEHQLLPVIYYNEAIQQMNTLLVAPYFYIFSDDINWVKDNLPIEQAVKFVSINTESELEDFALMKSCKHHIIANSSFSWWGAWLSESPNQNVIAPKDWFTHNSPKQKNDLVPKEWTQL